MPKIKLLDCYIAKLLALKKQFNNSTIQQFRSGFALIEIVLSTFLILIFVSIVLSASGTFIATRKSNLAYIAAKIASRHLEFLRKSTWTEITALPPGTVSISDPDLAKLPTSAATRSIGNYQTSSRIKQVIMKITWKENNANRELKMVSLFTENGM
ncbi:MAG: hypothetical protein UW37_C0036G0009 [Candidatus Gottesmanbacteria bacterium GW2011_GWA2_44_17]|uniref:Uncharacterized protein n=1 Tax=Candidatus Gottesmanbacteria bacterium GW2011_GWA2_44_17 TaxID=1618444 RepID=A0A0G1KDQ2_9BACT|nr:MAG: hypothetical protein UW37_C0036G0009 [Candidatus Gottesmanbacteria bacterium GW2011_GWA2_44_17]